MFSFLTNPFVSAFQYREILFRTTSAEIRQKYAGSVLGLLWLLLSPFLLLAIYSLVYIVIFRIQPASLGRFEYVLYILSGLVPFLAFGEALTSGSSSLTQNRAILLNTVFPSELVPLRSVLATQAAAVVGLALVLAFSLSLGKLTWAVLLVPFVWLFQLMFVMGLVWVLSLASLVLRDIQQMLIFVTTILLIVSPIAYTNEMVPAAVKVVVFINPLSYFVIGFHEVIVFGRLPSAGILTCIMGLGLISCGAGFLVFQRAKKAMFDYA